jgi:hypothetical protein
MIRNALGAARGTIPDLLHQLLHTLRHVNALALSVVTALLGVLDRMEGLPEPFKQVAIGGLISGAAKTCGIIATVRISPSLRKEGRI